MSFTPIRRLKVAEQIAARVRGAILSGDLQPGDSLPSERELAGQFEVNRGSVREALLRLESWGLIEVRHGGGSRVTDFLETAGLQLLPFLLAPSGQLNPAMLRDLLDLRQALLGFTALRAGQRATAESCEALAQVLAQLEAADEAPARQRLDYAFFEQLVAMSGNRVLGLVSNAVRRVYEQNAELFTVLYAGDFDTTAHRQTLAALQAGDAPGARAAMERYGGQALALFRGTP